MEQPPTKNEFSAESEHAPEELEARLRQLAQDYLAAFQRKPNAENLETAQLLLALAENLETAQLLFALGVPKLRRSLYEKLTSLLNEQQGGFPHAWQRWSWVMMVPFVVEERDGDPEAVGRDLILTMPVRMRAKCPDYPTNEAVLENAVAAVVAARNFKPELKLWKKCGDLDSLKLARAVLRGLGMDKDQANDLLRPKQWEAWLREHGQP